MTPIGHTTIMMYRITILQMGNMLRYGTEEVCMCTYIYALHIISCKPLASVVAWDFVGERHDLHIPLYVSSYVYICIHIKHQGTHQRGRMELRR